MRHSCAAVAIVLAIAEGLAAGQTAGERAAFEVASIRPLAANERGSNAISVLPGGRFIARAVTLRELIAAAYGLQTIQIVDPDRHLTDDRFAVEARTRGDVTAEDTRAMLRALLAERFGLAAHREMQELPVYLLVSAREDRRMGEHLRRSGPECIPPTPPQGIPLPPPPPPSERVPDPIVTLGAEPLRCLAILFMFGPSGGHWSVREVTISWLARRLTAELSRPVLDRTGLEGSFDLDLTFTPDAAAIPIGADGAPSLFTALQEQLGLTLESAREPVEILVIDRAEPPSAN